MRLAYGLRLMYGLACAQQVAERLGADAVSFGAPHAAAGAGPTAAGNPGTEAGAMLDMALLAACRDLVITAG